MKKTVLLLTLFLMACTATAGPSATSPSTAVATAVKTKIPTTMPAATLTHTVIPETPTVEPAGHPTITSQPPASCPALNKEAKLPLGPVFKNKQAAYHDVRAVILNFLNQGGDPDAAIEKLKEFNVHASTMDLTGDGVPEFNLPSGYFTIFGCQDGKYVNVLDLDPSQGSGTTAVPLVIQDLNQNGMLELLFGQVDGSYMASYQIFEWDGSRFKNLLSAELNKSVLYIEGQTIYAIGQSNAQKGRLEGNWEIIDPGKGPKRIAIRAGVIDTGSDQEHSVILDWDGKSYVVGNFFTKAPQATAVPTYVPLPFSATCANKIPGLRFQKPGPDDIEQAIVNFLNAGGNPDQIKGFYNTRIQDLNNDTAPEVIVIVSDEFDSFLRIFTCQEGKYSRLSNFPNEIGAYQTDILAVRDNNKNGFPEVFVRDIGCFSMRCGVLYVVEWDGKRFALKLQDLDDMGQVTTYTDMSEPADAYLRDLDNDGMAELIWTGEVTPEWIGDRWSAYPQRLATHGFKWDGQNYAAQVVEYSGPEFRFEAVQDGDRYSRAGLYEKALQFYQKAITSDALKWWTQDLKNSVIAPHGLGPCADKPADCPTPTGDPGERPVLSAYSFFRKVIVHLLMNDMVRAQNTYQDLLKYHPTGTPGYEITEMGTLFWNEYQASQNLGQACLEAVKYIETRPELLSYLTGGYNGFQGIDYERHPEEACPFE